MSPKQQSTAERVFISYAKEDSVFVERLRADLQDAGVETWVDSFNLIPGQLWERAIREAILSCSYFVAVLSKHSVSKRSYVQKEICLALEIAEKDPEGTVFIIPIRIDECESSFEGFKKLQRADLFPEYEKGLEELLRVFKYSSDEKPKLIQLDSKKIRGKIAMLTERGFTVWIHKPRSNQPQYFLS